VTGYLEPAAPNAATDIDIASIRVNGSVQVDQAAPTAIGDHDGNGRSDLLVKFDRVALELTLPQGDDVPVGVAGTVAGHAFSGITHLRVRRGSVSEPAAGSRLAARTASQVRWVTPPGVNVETVALLQSLDGGSTWSRVAGGAPNIGSYSWTAPDLMTDQAMVAVVTESATGGAADCVLGVSDKFSIGAPVGVGPDHTPLALAIRCASSVRSTDGRLRAEFALLDGSPARLELIDVAGRVVSAQQVGALGPGTHVLDLPQSAPLRSGVYFLRLAQGGHEVKARAAVLR
jgi:hypothetical protein